MGTSTCYRDACSWYPQRAASVAGCGSFITTSPTRVGDNVDPAFVDAVINIVRAGCGIYTGYAPTVTSIAQVVSAMFGAAALRDSINYRWFDKLCRYSVTCWLLLLLLYLLAVQWTWRSSSWRCILRHWPNG